VVLQMDTKFSGKPVPLAILWVHGTRSIARRRGAGGRLQVCFADVVLQVDAKYLGELLRSSSISPNKAWLACRAEWGMFIADDGVP
jgi:hypothetical protein